MYMTSEFRPESIEHYMLRGRRLRADAAHSVMASVGRILAHVIERALVRPYRMTRTRGCGCEA